MNLLRLILFLPYKIYIHIKQGRIYNLILKLPTFKAVLETLNNESPNSFKQFIVFKLFRDKNQPPWTVHKTSTIVGNWRNIHLGIDTAPGISPGCYIQSLGKIYLGDYVQIAPNVGIISSNHFMLDIRKHILSEVKIGAYSRIGLGSVILPGVELGEFTTVSAGAVVKDSFANGYCVIAGNPAQIVEDYSKIPAIKNKFLKYKNTNEYCGFYTAQQYKEIISK